jgi:hypothetical protein
MPIQPQTFNTRIRDHSGLSPQALLVALTISDLRYRKRLKPHEPLADQTLADLARLCHMPRSSLARWLKELTDSGWVLSEPVHRDGRRKANKYLLEDPTAAVPSDAGVTRDHANLSPRRRTQKRAGTANTESQETNKCDLSWDSVVRSNNNGAGDDAASCGVGVSDEQGEPSAAEVASADTATHALAGASASASADTAPGTTANSEPLTEEQLLDQIEAESRDTRLALPPPRQTNVVAQEGDRLAPACHHCRGRNPVLSDLHRPPGAPRLWECLECGRYWHKALRLVSA